MANWKDIVPRLGSVYDLRGNGRTALKVSLNKYVTAQGLQGTYGDTANPVNRMANIVTRSWVDGNGNFVPDCDLTNVFVQDFRPGGGDLCGTVSDTNFGRPTLSLNYNPKVLNGWGSRPYQWEFSASVQHELQRGLSMDVGYFRRWFGNFGVTDNLNLGPGDYGAFSVTAPVDARLPDGGGYTVSGFFNLNPDKVAVVPNNYFTFAKDHGVQTEHWNGRRSHAELAPGERHDVPGRRQHRPPRPRHLRRHRRTARSRVADVAVLPSERELPDRWKVDLDVQRSRRST